MAGGFGFTNYNAQVGSALQQPSAPMSGMMMRRPEPVAPPDPDRQVREMGAQLNAAPGQHDMDGGLAAAIGDHLTRTGGGYSTNPNPLKDRGRALQHLAYLGLRPEEVALLGESGGF